MLKVENKTNKNHVKAVNVISENSQMNYEQTLADQLLNRPRVEV